jgi:hypothetical protein
MLITSSWLHRQFVHFDANFRLTLEKRKARGEGSQSLWGSDGYFVDTGKYQQYLAKASCPREVRRLTYSILNLTSITDVYLCRS